MSRSESPFVTFIMPVRNEARYIERSLSSVLAQDYPSDRLEVLVVDGMSDDKTREIVRTVIAAAAAGRAGELPAVAVLDNPSRIVPSALNLGLRHARGDIIIRVDGHCEIADDYVRSCVDSLERTGSDCAGGPLLTLAESSDAQSIALAQSSFFGVGGVAFRTGRERPGYVDTLAFGAYRREVFERVGGFDEELVRNQDDEFNFRLTQSGGKIWLDPSIRSAYYSRASLGGLWRQYFEYGLYKVRVIQKRRAVPSWRHLVPGMFVLSLCVSVLLSLLTRRSRLTLLVAGPYLAATGAASCWTARRDWRTLPLLPAAYLTLHLAYGLGFLAGLWRWRDHWERL